MRSTKQSCADSEKLPLCSRRHYIAIADSRERNNLVIQVINQRAALSGRWFRRVRQEVVFESESCQNAANKKRPEQKCNPNENRLASYVTQQKENPADCYAIDRKDQSEPDI